MYHQRPTDRGGVRPTHVTVINTCYQARARAGYKSICFFGYNVGVSVVAAPCTFFFASHAVFVKMRPARPPGRGAGGVGRLARAHLAPWQLLGAPRMIFWRGRVQYVPVCAPCFTFIVLSRAVLMYTPLFFLPLLLRRTWQLGRREPPPNPACGAAVGHTGAPKFATGHQDDKVCQLAVARISMRSSRNRAHSFVSLYYP